MILPSDAKDDCEVGFGTTINGDKSNKNLKSVGVNGDKSNKNLKSVV